MTQRAVVLFAVVLLGSVFLYAQQTLRRVEVGVQTAMLEGSTQSAGEPGIPDSQWSLGPALTVNLNRYLAIDSSLSFFTANVPNVDIRYGGRTIEGLAGLKASIHTSKLTFFAKARPGFVSQSHMLSAVQQLPPYADSYTRQTNFAFDLGGGVEYAATPNLSVRSDLGANFIHRTSTLFSYDKYETNLLASTGIYYRFGRPVFSTPSYRDDENAHRFFDRKNLLLQTSSLLAQFGNAYTTQQGYSDCLKQEATWPNPKSSCAQQEQNPLSRPFVKHGWGGEIALISISSAVEVGVEYLFHKTGHHRIERIWPAASTASSAFAAYYDRHGL